MGISTFKPFKLTVKLESPVVFQKYPTRLDGLLWHCLFLQCHDGLKASEMLGDYLKVSDGVYHASFAKFGLLAPRKQLITEDNSQSKSFLHSLIAVNRATVGNMARNDLKAHMFAPNSKKGSYVNVMVEGGPYVTTIVKHKGFWADCLVFYGNGNGSEIASLIEFFIGAVGVNAAMGFGTIGSVKSQDIAEDLSLFNNGVVSRPIPVDFANIPQDVINNSIVDDAILKAPFRGQDSTRCYFPVDPITTEQISKF